MTEIPRILLSFAVALMFMGCELPRPDRNKFVYVGEYMNGKFHGHGTHTSVHGDRYIGEFRNGRRHGQGTLTSTTGNKYVGEFRKGKFSSGHATLTNTNGYKYVGKYKDGRAHGRGAETTVSGDRYVGEFMDGRWHGQGILTSSDGQVKEGVWEYNYFQFSRTPTPKIQARKSPPPAPITRDFETKSSPSVKSATSGSGFFVSKLGHIVTNQHVVKGCGRVTVGDNAKKQVAATVLETDKRNDLALLRLSSIQMASAETKSLIQKLGIRVLPLSSNGLLRSDDVQLGERLLVAGYPYGEIFSNTIKVTGGMVSAIRGIGDDTGQFQMDAAVQPGNSGGPIYDENGNIVGVVVTQLNKLKVAKAIGSMPENVNFGIKASTVKQFLTTAGLPTKWSARSKPMSTTELAKIAKNQTVMVVCHL
jgi:S1-C subfamily serine protease